MTQMAELGTIERQQKTRPSGAGNTISTSDDSLDRSKEPLMPNTGISPLRVQSPSPDPEEPKTYTHAFACYCGDVIGLRFSDPECIEISYINDPTIAPFEVSDVDVDALAEALSEIAVALRKEAR